MLSQNRLIGPNKTRALIHAKIKTRFSVHKCVILIEYKFHPGVHSDEQKSCQNTVAFFFFWSWVSVYNLLTRVPHKAQD